MLREIHKKMLFGLKRTQCKRKRQRGVVLTHAGLQKLQSAKSEAESSQNLDRRFTLETLSARTGLDPDTKIFTTEAQSTLKS